MCIGMSRLLRAGLVLAFGWSLAVAAPSVELSGNWKLNVEKSKFGALPAPVSRTVEIIHREPNLKVKVTEDTGTETRSQTLEYTTDGKQCLNMVRGREFRSVVRWEEAVLVIETKGVYQGDDFRSTDRWSLSPDRKTITIERHATNPYGETHQTLMLEKQ